MRISVRKFLECIKNIYDRHPTYKLGQDGLGKENECDCIGMPRGALIMAGVDDVHDMNGTNQAVRNVLQNVDKLKKKDQLQLGDCVLKVRDKDDKSMPLPDKYRKGEKAYDPKWGEINFTHIGTVFSLDPFQIIHMTSPTAKIDDSIKGWSYFGQYPWVSDIEEDPTIEKAIVFAESGETVKMRKKPSSMCSVYWRVPIGSEVTILEHGESWSRILWAGKQGYMMSKFLLENCTCSLVIPNLSRADAEILKALYPSSYIEIEKG